MGMPQAVFIAIFVEPSRHIIRVNPTGIFRKITNQYHDEPMNCNYNYHYQPLLTVINHYENHYQPLLSTIVDHYHESL
jgi:hypothetical protein